ncbi:S-norcoclaurine synthase 1 [Hibiscus syriacus]|uniref:S-norcoclaurine synthase 1 n=1 Tax=Hibiscus syriacus TaxID=106335 RepID=A0A6A2WF35_HIBSY|nr:S-norcoclaurine synthase 1 [Hibiscus syriacus]
MNYYPPCAEANKVYGVAPHSDATGLTLFLQVNEGLQIKRNEKWVPVKPVPVALIINTGDMMEAHRILALLLLAALEYEAGSISEGGQKGKRMLGPGVQSLVPIGYLPVENVQSLASKNLKNIPPRYIRPEVEFDVVSVDESLQIPVIDMSKLDDDVDEQKKLHLACKYWGFFQLMNHGVEDEVIEKMKMDIQEFFNLPLEEKMAYALIPNHIEGYGQSFVVSEDQKLDWGDMLFLSGLPVSTRNMRFWPTNPPSFRSAFDKYLIELNKVKIHLIKLIAKNLGTDPEKLMKAIMRKDGCLVAINERLVDFTDDNKWIEMDGNAMANFHLALADELTSLSCKIGEQERAELLLQSLPDSYDQLIINLTNNNFTSLVFDDVAAAVLQEENRCKNKEDRQVNLQQAEALTTMTTMRGRSTERGQSNSHKHGRSKSRSKKNLKCYNCGKKGHLKKDCWSLNKNSNPQGNIANTSDDGDALCCEASMSNAVKLLHLSRLFSRILRVKHSHAKSST